VGSGLEKVKNKQNSKNQNVSEKGKKRRIDDLQVTFFFLCVLFVGRLL
jgi:hypothetical protein